MTEKRRDIAKSFKEVEELNKELRAKNAQLHRLHDKVRFMDLILSFPLKINGLIYLTTALLLTQFFFASCIDGFKSYF